MNNLKFGWTVQGSRSAKVKKRLKRVISKLNSIDLPDGVMWSIHTGHKTTRIEVNFPFSSSTANECIYRLTVHALLAEFMAEFVLPEETNSTIPV